MSSFKTLIILLTQIFVIAEYTEEPSLAERVQELSNAASEKPVLWFNTEKFRHYVNSSPRNYSMIVMFTALAPSRQCGRCWQAYDEFHLVGNSWRDSKGYSSQLFFATVDLDEGFEAFQELQLKSAPVFLHFPARGKPKKEDKFDHQRVGFAAESIARWVGERTDIYIRIVPPTTYSGVRSVVLVLVLVMASLYIHNNNNWDFLYSTTTWALSALVFTVAMTSGQMWNYIRGPPFLAHTETGKIAYIHGSSNGQFLFETYIVAIINAVVVLGMILITEAANNRDNIHKRQFNAIFGLGLVSFFFSIINSLFRSKLPSE